MVLETIFTALLITSPAAASMSEWSPGCEDDDAQTACCPLEDLELLGKSLADWYACLDSILLPVDETNLRNEE